MGIFFNSTGRDGHFSNSTGRHGHFLNSTGRHWALLKSTRKIRAPPSRAPAHSYHRGAGSAENQVTRAHVPT